MTRPVILAGLLTAAFLAAAEAVADDPAPAGVFELRTYHTNPGKLDALNARFRDHTNALFRKHGITPVGYWTPMDDKQGKGETLTYLIAFPSREAAQKSWQAFRDDPEWQRVKAESEKEGVLVKKVDSTYLETTDYSPKPLQAQEKTPGSPRVFELRTYVASPGKFDDLHKRFREHTLDIFRNHGMTSVGYWVPMDADQGHENTLIYLLAFPNREAAQKSWQAFRDDPAWQKVFRESQPDGVPLAAKVTSVFLEPTDYSPIQ